jgi:hypothetical protein
MSLLPVTPRGGEIAALALRTFKPISDPSKECGFRRVPWRIHHGFTVQADRL